MVKCYHTEKALRIVGALQDELLGFPSLLPITPGKQNEFLVFVLPF